MWSLVLVPLTVAVVAGVLAWRHGTRIDRQVERESWPRQAEPDVSLGLALGALVAAVAAATVLQLMLLPRIVQ